MFGFKPNFKKIHVTGLKIPRAISAGVFELVIVRGPGFFNSFHISRPTVTKRVQCIDKLILLVLQHQHRLVMSYPANLDASAYGTFVLSRVAHKDFVTFANLAKDF